MTRPGTCAALLVVLALPRDEADWLAVTPEALILQPCAYLVSLVGDPKTENETSVTISIPVT